MGHSILLIPAQHLKPFVRGNNTDTNDAVAIIEASQRPNLRFVPMKTTLRVPVPIYFQYYGVKSPSLRKSPYNRPAYNQGMN